MVVWVFQESLVESDFFFPFLLRQFPSLLLPFQILGYKKYITVYVLGTCHGRGVDSDILLDLSFFLFTMLFLLLSHIVLILFAFFFLPFIILISGF